MNRRRFVFTAAVGVLAAPLAAEAQPMAGKVWRIGYVAPPAGPNAMTDPFVRGLRDGGYVEGRNVIIEYRYMAGREIQYPDVLAELGAG